MSDRWVMEGFWRDLYSERKRGDAVAMAQRFAPGATLRINGLPDGAPGREAIAGEEALTESLKELIATFTFLEADILKSVVEGPTAAIHWRARVRHNPSGRVTDTDVLDLFTVHGGRVTSYLQFCDTATVADLMAPN